MSVVMSLFCCHDFIPPIPIIKCYDTSKKLLLAIFLNVSKYY